MLAMVATGAQAEVTKAELQELNTSFVTQIAPCLASVPATVAEPTRIALRVGIDTTGRPIADSIAVAESNAKGPLNDGILPALRTAITTCAGNGIALPASMVGRKIMLVVPFQLEPPPAAPAPEAAAR